MDGAHYEAAIKLFEKLESNYPFGTYATQAQMEIAYAHYKAQDQAEALASVERFIKLHPNHPQVDYMYYLRGLINFNDQIGFLSFIYAGPDRARPEGDPRSLRRLQGTGRQVPEQQIRAGFDPAHELPDQRDGRLRSARGELLLPPRRLPGRAEPRPGRRDRLRGSPAREEALFIMIRSYDKLGMFDLRDDTQRVFQKNYPNSRFLGGKGNGDAPWWKFWAKSGPQAGAEGCCAVKKTPADAGVFFRPVVPRRRESKFFGHYLHSFTWRLFSLAGGGTPSSAPSTHSLRTPKNA
jgi:outer membrane protein assembly factor BamD